MVVFSAEVRTRVRDGRALLARNGNSDDELVSGEGSCESELKGTGAQRVKRGLTPTNLALGVPYLPELLLDPGDRLEKLAGGFLKEALVRNRKNGRGTHRIDARVLRLDGGGFARSFAGPGRLLVDHAGVGRDLATLALDESDEGGNLDGGIGGRTLRGGAPSLSLSLFTADLALGAAFASGAGVE